jgi:3-hydroxybutyrate dehydrogenase
MRLAGKVALVTGAARGIGYAIAHRFAVEGASVAILDLDQSLCDESAASIKGDTGGKALGLQTDITNEDEVQAAVEKVLSEYGAIDILVSNAGNQIIGSLDKFSYQDWRKIMSVHLDGAFLVTRACLQHMYARGTGGSLIYLGSVHSKLASVLKAPYVTAKHGVLGLCRAVAKEGAAHGVRANVICPGFVLTKLVEKQIPEQAEILGLSEEDVIRKVMLKDTVDGHFTTVEEIASAAVFLASADSLAFTGQSMNVTHGWCMD